MEVINNFTDELTGKVVVKINKEDYQPKVDKQLKELRKKVTLKGFRPGHVPVQIVKKFYGKEVLFDEVFKLVNEALEDFVKKENLRLIGDFMPIDEETKFDYNKEDNYEFAYKYTFTSIPAINYEEITIPEYKIKVEDKDIDERIDYYRNRFGEFVEEEQVGDKSKITVTLREVDEEGKVKEDGLVKEEVPFLIEYVSDKYKEELKGKKVGDKIQIKLSEISENETERAQILGVKADELASQPDNFEMEITKIEKFEQAELNEDFFKKVFPTEEIKTEEEFRQKVKEQIEKDYEQLAKDRLVVDLKDVLTKTVEVKIDEEGLLDWLEYSEKSKKEEERLSREELKKHIPDLIKSIKWSRIVEKIADDLNVQLERADSLKVQADYIAYSLQQYGIDPSMLGEDFLMQQAEEEYNKLDANGRSQIDLYALENKALAAALEKVNKEEREVTMDFFRSLYKTEEEKAEENKEEKEEKKTTAKKTTAKKTTTKKTTAKKTTTKKTAAKKSDDEKEEKTTEKKTTAKKTTAKKTTTKKTTTKKTTKKDDDKKEE